MFCFAGQAYAAVGVATQVNGGVTLTRDYKMFALEKGVEINVHDVIRTGPAGGAQLDMNDGSSLSIGANSTMNLSDYTLREDKMCGIHHGGRGFRLDALCRGKAAKPRQ